MSAQADPAATNRPADVDPVLAVRGLVTEFSTPDGTLRAVDEVSWELYPGETLGVVGESGSGKSVSVMSVLGLIPQPPGRIIAGEALLEGRDLLQMSERELRGVRGGDIAMVFQDPMTSLNPVLTVGDQIDEAVRTHNPDLGDEDVRTRTVTLLHEVGVPNADERADQYPHEYSGGMRQRAMIAMAVANRPKVLVADEPTTALDVTIQAQVLDVLRKAQEETHAATILITHDLGLVAEMCDRVVVMYAGRVIETGDVDTIFNASRHPYTLGLMASLPRLDQDLERLAPIGGNPPSLLARPPGCAFHPRCRLTQGRERCREELPPLYETNGDPSGGHRDAGEPVPSADAALGTPFVHRAACHFTDEVPDLRRTVEAEIGASLTGGASTDTGNGRGGRGESHDGRGGAVAAGARGAGERGQEGA